MGLPFSRTLAAFEAERSVLSVAAWIFAGLGALAAAVWWMACAEVSLFEVSTSARVEHGAVHRVTAAVGGRVVRHHAELGREVRVGDLLVELDDEVEQRRLAEAEAHLRGLEPQLDALRAQIALQRSLLPIERKATSRALAAAAARRSDAEAAAVLAQAEADRASSIDQYLPAAEQDRARGEATRARARVQATSHEHAYLEHARTAAEEAIVLEARQLERELVRMQSEVQAATIRVEIAEGHLERRRIRATVDGRIVSVSPALVDGAGLEVGEGVATILAAGEPRIVAELTPSSIGRVRPGLAARVSLEAFPWIQHGTVGATVSRVATEVIDDVVRVELVLDADALPSSIPLQHGLACRVEIEVERATPAVIVGRLLGEGLRSSSRGHAQSSHQEAP